MEMEKVLDLNPKAAAEAAINSIGLGYDLTADLSFKYCKSSRLIVLDDHHLRTVDLPGRIEIPNVPKSIKCDKGDRIRLCSDVFSFQQMSEQFNQELSLSGKIPTGHFNAAFEFSGVWQKDAANTKTLAFDGVYITLYNFALEKTQVALCDYVKQAVPSYWNPADLARFIEKFGTHVIVGVKIGGTDIIYAKQQYSSPLQPADVQKKLNDIADKFFIDQRGEHNAHDGMSNGTDEFIKEDCLGLDFQSGSYSELQVQDIKFMCKRKGGSLKNSLSHNKWCQTVLSQPDVISMSLIPISSLLNGVNGSGYITHAINLYLRYKPPVEDLIVFFDLQLPRQWAPVFSELALVAERKPRNTASLQFSFMGPKLYVNTTPVDVGKKPVTGLRLYLEGKRSNQLAIHLLYLSSPPRTFQLEYDNSYVSDASSEHEYYEKVQWKSFSHVCTAPVESEDDEYVVTGAHLEVRDTGLKNVLFLRLHFSKLVGATTRGKAPEWDGSLILTQNSGLFSTLISTHFSGAQNPSAPPRPSDVNINSALYPGGPPIPTPAHKLLRFVDTTEVTRGPQDLPGCWIVSGARLCVEKGKITLRVKYSLLTAVLPNEEALGN